MNKYRIVLFFLSVLLMFGCGSTKKSAESTQTGGNNVSLPEPIYIGHPDEIVRGEQALPHAIVYKMKKDYSKNVPVILSEDKTTIISYPAITDVFFNGKLAYPTNLLDGYLLDNCGINKNVAFLSYTYEEYAALSTTPSIDELYKKIIDKDPLVEIVDCGLRDNYKNGAEDIKKLIEDGFQRIPEN